MTSGGGPEGYCNKCGIYSQSRTINHGGLCLACDERKCRNCPHVTNPVKEHNDTFPRLIWFCKKMGGKIIDDVYSIPEWCPFRPALNKKEVENDNDA